LLGGKESKFIRKELELSQKDFAKRLDVNRVTVANWEAKNGILDGPTSIAIRALAMMPDVSRHPEHIAMFAQVMSQPLQPGRAKRYTLDYAA